MDKVEQLYNLYLQKGLISKAVTLDDWRNVNPDQQAKLFQLGKSKNLFSSVTENDFKSAWGELKKKETSQPVSTAPQGQRTEPSAKVTQKDKPLPLTSNELLFTGALKGLMGATTPAKKIDNTVSKIKEKAKKPEYQETEKIDIEEKTDAISNPKFADPVVTMQQADLDKALFYEKSKNKSLLDKFNYGD